MSSLSRRGNGIKLSRNMIADGLSVPGQNKERSLDPPHPSPLPAGRGNSELGTRNPKLANLMPLPGWERALVHPMFLSYSRLLEHQFLADLQHFLNIDRSCRWL